jgi:exodeoxyribonuclease VII large subunit
VSDLRAPTPSAAAELAVFDVRACMAQLEGYQAVLSGSMLQKLKEYRLKAEQYKRLFRMKHPMYQIREQKQYLADVVEHLMRSMKRQIAYKRSKLWLRVSQLKGLSPLEKLEQGLAYVSKTDGNVVYSVDQVEQGEILVIQVKDGKIQAVVNDKEQTDVKEEYGL